MEKRDELFPLRDKFIRFIKKDIPVEVLKLTDNLEKEYLNNPASMFLGIESWIESHNKLTEKEKEIAIEFFHFSNEDNLRRYIINTMKEVYFDKGYSMIVDDICELLDLDEKYIRSTILPYVDHFQCPKYSSDFFEWGIGLDFLEMARKRNKRVFINVDSFNKYLEEHLFIKCPYVDIRFYENANGCYPVERDAKHNPKIKYTEVPYNINCNFSFLKTTSIPLFLENKKRVSLLKTTKRNIISTYSNPDSGLTKEMLKEQMEIACREISNVPIQVYDNEINSFLKSDKCFRVILRPDVNNKKDKTIVLCAFSNNANTHLMISHQMLEVEKNSVLNKIKQIDEEIEQDKKDTDFI